MGITFTDDATKYLHQHYGGHPLLTRLACSHAAGKCKEKIPTSIKTVTLKKDEEKRDLEIVFYCQHVLTELKDFYPSEFEILELIAIKQTAEYMEFMKENEYIGHLYKYGLIEDRDGIPVITIPVLEKFIGLEHARKDGRKTITEVIKKKNRLEWLNKRINSIINEFKELNESTASYYDMNIFKHGRMEDINKISDTKLVTDKGTLSLFLTDMYIGIVEPLEIPKKEKYKELVYAVERIVTYRNHFQHSVVYPEVQKKYEKYICADLEGKTYEDVKDSYFIIQQCIMDDLLLAIIRAESRISP